MLLIKDALVAGAGDRAPFLGWVRVEGERIAGVGEGASPTVAGAQVIDARDRILVPGFVNTHAHSHSSLTRGTAEGMALEAWIASIIREQSRLTAEQARVGALATYAEALLSGTTCIVDMCLFPEAALEAAQEIGIRAVIVPYVADSMPFAPTLERNKALLRRCSPRDAVHAWVGLHDLETCSDAQIRAGSELAHEHNVGVHLHCSESRASTQKTVARTGRTPVAHLQALGVFEGPAHLAHCVWVDEADRRTMAERRVSVAHCPHANLKVASGIAPVAAMRSSGVRIGLGTDGAKANNRLDMFDVMKFASLLAKGITLDPATLPAPAVLAMATRDGAAALGLDTCDIAPGRLADLTLIAADRFHLQPATPQTAVTNIVHAARGSDVDTVIVGGRITVERGRLATLDQGELFAQYRSTGRALMEITAEAAA